MFNRAKEYDVEAGEDTPLIPLREISYSKNVNSLFRKNAIRQTEFYLDLKRIEAILNDYKINKRRKSNIFFSILASVSLSGKVVMVCLLLYLVETFPSKKTYKETAIDANSITTCDDAYGSDPCSYMDTRGTFDGLTAACRQAAEKYCLAFDRHAVGLMFTIIGLIVFAALIVFALIMKRMDVRRENFNISHLDDMQKNIIREILERHGFTYDANDSFANVFATIRGSIKAAKKDFKQGITVMKLANTEGNYLHSFFRSHPNTNQLRSDDAILTDILHYCGLSDPAIKALKIDEASRRRPR